MKPDDVVTTPLATIPGDPLARVVCDSPGSVDLVLVLAGVAHVDSPTKVDFPVPVEAGKISLGLTDELGEMADWTVPAL